MGDVISDPFHVGNGVRQGGILSPFLFNLYMDNLSDKLNLSDIGCITGNTRVNHLMYADDLVIFSPYSGGLSALLKICEGYGIENDIKFNSKKTVLLAMKPNNQCLLSFPEFYLNGELLRYNSEAKYLGHFITDNMYDDKDIRRQCGSLYGQGNSLKSKFSMCSVGVKIKLLKSYCTSFYTAQLWWHYHKYSMQKLKVAYNDILRTVLSLPRFHSASQLFVNHNVPSLGAVLRNLIFKFMCRLDKSANSIIKSLVNPLVSDVRYTSKIWNHWHKALYVHFDNG